MASLSDNILRCLSCNGLQMDAVKNFMPNDDKAGLRFDNAPVNVNEMNNKDNVAFHFNTNINECNFQVNRPVFTQQEFDEKHGAKDVTQSLWQRTKTSLSNVQFNSKLAKSAAFSIFPVVKIMRKYHPKEDLINDLISGLTVGIMHIPQSMAYAMLASLPPVYGLYTSFFPVIVYFIFGTSRQISIGTIAIVSLLTGSLVENNVLPRSIESFNCSLMDMSNYTNNTNFTSNCQDDISKDLNQRKVVLASAVCMVVGIIQFFMGVSRIGFFTRYLSDPLISGFTVGASFVVFTSQVKNVFGLTVPRHSGLFAIPLQYVDIIVRLPKTNFATFGISIICMIILYVFKEYINPKVRQKIKAPVPIELILVVLATILSYYLDFKKKAGIKIVGNIPGGFPIPSVPNASLVQPFILECVIIAIIAFSVNISLAKIFSKKHGYKIDSNKEFIAYGLSNFVGSFFSCYPSSGSVSRSAVQDTMGGVTQMASVFSTLLLTFVLLFIGPYFETVPTCVLAAIIIVALKSMFEQASEVKILWRTSMYDFITWMVTCICVILLTVELGLVIGVVWSVFSIIFRTQGPTANILGRIVNTDLYKNIRAYSDAVEVEGLKIYRYEGSIYFASAEHFKANVVEMTGVDAISIGNRRKKLLSKRRLEKKAQASTSDIIQNGSTCYMVDEEENEEIAMKKDPRYVKCNVHHIIIDCSTWGYIDYVGIRTLSQIIRDYNEVNVKVFLANPKTGIRNALERSDFYEKNSREIIYVSVHDAVVAALYFHNEQRRKSENKVGENENQTYI